MYNNLSSCDADSQNAFVFPVYSCKANRASGIDAAPPELRKRAYRRCLCVVVIGRNTHHRGLLHASQSAILIMAALFLKSH